jgi:hypothetical protein
MKLRFFHTLFTLIVLVLVVSSTSFAQEKQPPKKYTPEELFKLDKGKSRPPTGPKFEVIFAEGTKASYVVVLHSEDQGFVQDIYHVSQIGIIEAILVEAAKFGLTEEAVGGAKPLTTRFSDPQLPGFFIDVSKLGRQSRFYVTLKGINGKLTVDAGVLKRVEKKPGEDKQKEEVREPIFFDKLLATIQAAKQTT